MSEQLNPYAAPMANVDNGGPTVADLRKRFRRPIVWTLILIATMLGGLGNFIRPDPTFIGLLIMPSVGALIGGLTGWLVSTVLWYPYWLVTKRRSTRPCA